MVDTWIGCPDLFERYAVQMRYHAWMKRIGLLIAIVATVIVGCSSPPAEVGDGPSQADSEDVSRGNGEGGVQALTGGAGAGGATPVAGNENLGGGSGGGVGNAAKDAARGASTKVSGTDQGQSDQGQPSDETGTPDD